MEAPERSEPEGTYQVDPRHFGLGGPDTGVGNSAGDRAQRRELARMTPADALRNADLHSQLFGRAVAGKIMELLPGNSKLRFRLQITVDGRNVRVEPQLRMYREGKDHSG